MFAAPCGAVETPTQIALFTFSPPVQSNQFFTPSFTPCDFCSEESSNPLEAHGAAAASGHLKGQEPPVPRRRSRSAPFGGTRPCERVFGPQGSFRVPTLRVGFWGPKAEGPGVFFIWRPPGFFDPQGHFPRGSGFPVKTDKQSGGAVSCGVPFLSSQGRPVGPKQLENRRAFQPFHKNETSSLFDQSRGNQGLEKLVELELSQV